MEWNINEIWNIAYSKISGSLWQFYREEPAVDNNEDISSR